MKRVLALVLFAISLISGCGVEDALRRNDDRYARPGALDAPLTNVYMVYQYKFLDRYRVSHEWPYVSNCRYSGRERNPEIQNQNLRFYDALDIYEDGNVTKQRAAPGKNFNQFVRSEISPERFYTDAFGERKGYPSKEEGFRPLCYESWWGPSHALRLRLHKLSMPEFEAMYSELYPEGRWSWKVLEGRRWRVQETDRQHLRPRDGVGGPYQTWITPIGDSGYAIALEMTASQDSLAYPKFFDALEQVYRRLIASVRIEPLAP